MSTTVTTNRIGARQVLALVALALFFISALCFHGTITEWSGSTMLAAGLCFLTASIAVWF